MAVDRFREYLRIKTVQPEPDYQSAIGFIERQAHEIGLTYKCIEVAKGYPVAILSWYGSQPDLPSIMLNSHMDVVPVYPVTLGNHLNDRLYHAVIIGTLVL
jgi:aminoacylase